MEGADAETYSILQRMDIYPEQLTEDAFRDAFEQAVANPCTGICLSACLQRNIVCIMRIW